MDQFVAVAKLKNAPHPIKVQFGAATVGDAITAMLSALQITTTVSIEEYEILRITEANTYQIVATKNKQENRLVEPKVVSPPVVIGNIVETEEREYTSYETKAA